MVAARRAREVGLNMLFGARVEPHKCLKEIREDDNRSFQ